jgi:hypothetical protein
MFEHPEWAIPVALASAGLTVEVLYAALPLLRRDAPLRFFAVGAALSVVPLAGTFPSDRYLFWAGLGVMGILARLVAWALLEGPSRVTPLRYAVACACLLLRAVVSPLAFPIRAAGPGLIEDDLERTVDTIPRGPGFAGKTVVVLSAPSDVFSICLPVAAMARGLPWPAHMYSLYAGQDDVTVTRLDPSTLDVSAAHGWLSRFTDRLFRGEPQREGETVSLAAMRAEVASVTPDGRATETRFHFDRDVDDGSIELLAWGPRGFEPVEAPPVGASLTLAAAPLFLSDVMRPHVRHRPMEEDP